MRSYIYTAKRFYQIAKNDRTSIELSEKYDASHLKDTLDASAINGWKSMVRTVRRCQMLTFFVAAVFVWPMLMPALYIKSRCGRGGTVDATDLCDLSALWETEDAELLKFGGTSYVAIPSQAREGGKV
ncbi:MAG: hypothetical protein ACREDD_09360 [Methylocella sp.]